MPKLALIALGQTAGFSLDEIGTMFAPDGRMTIDRRKLLDKADELDRTLRRLGDLRDGLRHAAACPAPNHFGCAKFRRMLAVAVRGTTTRRRRAKKSVYAG